MTTTLKPQRALISVSDKTNLVPFCRFLTEQDIEIISTGGTAKLIQEAGLAVTLVSEVTGFPEIMQGRVKTLHPKIHGGILGKRQQHLADAQRYDIEWIDLVVCNLYPFAKTVENNPDLDLALDNIDIGGPSMIRSAAKNFPDVAVLVDPSDYFNFQRKMTAPEGITLDYRQKLAAKAFGHTTWYDELIYHYLSESEAPAVLNLSYHKHSDLRYGENPHQKAALYQNNGPFVLGIGQAKIHQGKELSYNNIVDADGALNCLLEFEQPACVVVKHANPCGVASSDQIDTAFAKAWAADSKSAFGGIVALNRPCTGAIAKQLSEVFIEILIAPSYEDEALSYLSRKKNLRVLELSMSGQFNSDLVHRFISGGLLIQDRDRQVVGTDNIEVVTQLPIPKSHLPTAVFGWQVLKHIKSNGILIAKDMVTLGVGAGQVSRVDAVELAIHKAAGDLEGAVLLSDAFFPFADSIDIIAQTSIKTIIQPGGSIKDADVITACDRYGIAMGFTGKRCFNH